MSIHVRYSKNRWIGVAVEPKPDGDGALVLIRNEQRLSARIHLTPQQIARFPLYPKEEGMLPYTVPRAAPYSCLCSPRFTFRFSYSLRRPSPTVRIKRISKGVFGCPCRGTHYHLTFSDGDTTVLLELRRQTVRGIARALRHAVDNAQIQAARKRLGL